MNARAVAIATGIALFAAHLAHADATIDQKTQIHFGGAMSIVNVFGGKATHDGAESSTAVKGDRKSTRTGGSGEIIDLSEEKVYRVDYDRKTYKVVTFDELRTQYEEMKRRSEKSTHDEKSSSGPELEVEFDVRSTGKKETINGWATHNEVVTVTVHEKGKKLEQSGGWVLTADLWIGPKIAAWKELSDFDRRYVQKVYGNLYSGADTQAMMTAMAQTPAFAKAMKAFADKRSTFDGSPVRTMLTFEVVAGANGQPDESSSTSSSPAALVGGLLGRMKKRDANDSASTPGRSKLFDSTVELLKATASASASDVAVPADFKQK